MVPKIIRKKSVINLSLTPTYLHIKCTFLQQIDLKFITPIFTNCHLKSNIAITFGRC